jgi:hypothetical protein
MKDAEAAAAGASSVVAGAQTGVMLVTRQCCFAVPLDSGGQQPAFIATSML